MDTLILICDVEREYPLHRRGINNPSAVINLPSIKEELEELTQDELLRRARSIGCMKEDVPTIVEEISKYNLGVEIRVYTLTEQFTRLPGELKSVNITKDGKLPF